MSLSPQNATNEPEDRCGGCGPGIFNFGKRDIFYPCCVPHDQEYKMSAEIYAKGVTQADPAAKLLGLQMKQLADHNFFRCLRVHAENRSWIHRFLYNTVGVFYSGNIVIYSDKYWAKLVSNIIETNIREDMAGAASFAQTSAFESDFLQILKQD